MGRKFCVLFIWEGNGKEMLSIISKGGKWEGNNVDFPFGREKGRKLTFSFPFLSGKGNPIDPCIMCSAPRSIAIKNSELVD